MVVCFLWNWLWQWYRFQVHKEDKKESFPQHGGALCISDLDLICGNLHCWNDCQYPSCPPVPRCSGEEEGLLKTFAFWITITGPPLAQSKYLSESLSQMDSISTEINKTSIWKPSLRNDKYSYYSFWLFKTGSNPGQSISCNDRDCFDCLVGF